MILHSFFSSIFTLFFTLFLFGMTLGRGREQPCHLFSYLYLHEIKGGKWERENDVALLFLAMARTCSYLDHDIETRTNMLLTSTILKCP